MLDQYGAVGKACDAEGKCTCQPGHTGDKCDQCLPEHYMLNNNCEGTNFALINTLHATTKIFLLSL